MGIEWGVSGWLSHTADLELQSPGTNADSRVHVWMGACGGQESTPGVLPVTVLVFETWSLDSLTIPGLAGVAAGELLGSACLCFPSMALAYKLCLASLRGPGD